MSFFNRMNVYGFLIYIFLSIFNNFGERNYSNILSYNQTYIEQIIGLLIFWLTSIWILLKDRKSNFKIEQPFLFFFASIILSSILSFELYSTFFSIIFCINLLLIAEIFEHKIVDIKKSLFFFSMLIFGILYYHLIVFGVDYFAGRWVGNFKPNNIALIAFLSMVLIFFSSQHKYYRLLSLILFLIIDFLVIARGALVASIIFLFSYYANYSFFNKKMNSFTNLFIIAIVIIFITTNLFYNDLMFYIKGIVTYLDFTDPERGIGSGGTGRIELWRSAIDVFKENPLFGVGLRNLSQSPHNGYLELLAQNGLVGFLAYFILVLGAFIKAAKILKKDYVHEINIAISFIISFLALSMIERDLINLASFLALTFYFFINFIYKYQLK